MATFVQRARSADHKSNCVVFGFIKQMEQSHYVTPQLINYIVLCYYFDKYSLIRVRSYHHEDTEMIFQINEESTNLERIMNIYCNRVGREGRRMRFLYDGDRLDPNKTWKEFINEFLAYADDDWWEYGEESIDAMHESCNEILGPLTTNPTWKNQIVKI